MTNAKLAAAWSIKLTWSLLFLFVHVLDAKDVT